MLKLVELILLTLCTGALTWFFQLTLSRGMIFRKYYGLIFYYLHFKPRKVYGIINSQTPKQLEDNHFRRAPFIVHPKKWYAHLFEPLGGCPYCNGQWIYTGIFLAFYLPIPLREAITLFLLGSGTNYIWIEIISKWK